MRKTSKPWTIILEDGDGRAVQTADFLMLYDANNYLEALHYRNVALGLMSSCEGKQGEMVLHDYSGLYRIVRNSEP